MTADRVHRSELGEFLKARRADLTPRAIGLPDGGSMRRVPGLRRDEVAELTAISVDYYTRLEQGRVQASASVLAALARALRLDDDQRAYLYELAGKSPARPRRRARQQVRPQLQRILDQLTETPAIVLGHRMDILAWNPLAAALITDFAQIPESQRNYVRLIFTDPAMRHLYADWETQARTCVALLRMQADDTPEDPRLAALVGELSVQDPDFRSWWAARHVDSKHFGTKTLRHPKAGDITLDWDTFGCAADPDQHLIIWTVEPDTPSHQALRFLASWTAERPPPAGGTTA